MRLFGRGGVLTSSAKQGKRLDTVCCLGGGGVRNRI